MNARQYREHLYQHKAHPNQNPTSTQSSDSIAMTFSAALFLVGEYFFELKFLLYPSGLFFPVGYLFFWAFYYTYRAPGYLEKALAHEHKWDIAGIPMTLLQSCIWFVKVTMIELTDKIISSLMEAPKPHASKAKARRSQPPPLQRETPSAYSASARGSHTKVPPPLKTPQDLPTELSNALRILGIPEARNWAKIQKRYRELAKQFHPDLNPESTQAGNRFMLYDAAYRRLELAKTRYFDAKGSPQK